MEGKIEWASSHHIQGTIWKTKRTFLEVIKITYYDISSINWSIYRLKRPDPQLVQWKYLLKLMVLHQFKV